MSKRFAVAVVAAAVLAALPLGAAEPAPKLERIEWSDIWITDADRDELPRVLLVGDSIVRGYYDGVEKALAGKAACARYTTSKFLGNPDYAGELGLILDTLGKSNQVTKATSDFLNKRQDDLIELFTHLDTATKALNKTAPKLEPLMQRLFELNPKWQNSTPGSAATVATKLYWLTPGVGFDSASRWPELQDLEGGIESLQQTLSIVLARLTGNGAT